MQAQQEVGYIERFAIAADRREALRELIPGTDDYYYYHCLYHQNQRQLAEARAILDQWKTRLGENERVVRMTARQMLLSYETAPEATLKYLRERLGVQLEHAPPSRDRAADLASRLDPARLDPAALLESAIARDASLSQVATRILPQLVGRRFAPDQLRTWLSRLERADFDGLVKRIAEELALGDSRGFGWARVHQMLSLAQLDELLKSQPKLLEREAFVRAYIHRLVPSDDVSLDDARELRSYLERLAKFARTLPASQNSTKALVIGNLLRLNLRENKMERSLFLEYLGLPRNAPYYATERFQNRAVTLADLAFNMEPQVLLPPVGDDGSLVRRYLEHFFAAEDKTDDFAQYLNRDYLEKVLAETKILTGASDAARWYAKLNPTEQKALRERVELRFGPQNKNQFSTNEAAQLSLELKNVPQLLVKIYQINPLNYYRTAKRPISTDIDLDGLVANWQRQMDFTQPADRRHAESLTLPELEGRGVWVVDILGGGQRSRALIQKGSLSSVIQLTDAGQIVQVIDDEGKLVKSAHVEIDGRSFEGDSKGHILIPYAENTRMQDVHLVDGDFAVLEKLMLQGEYYQLHAGFVIDRQTLIAGTRARLLMRARLDSNGLPTSLRLLEKAQLSIAATDQDGIATSQTISDLKLSDSQEFLHEFLVPQRLASIQFTLSGRVAKQSRDERQDVSASETVACNDNSSTSVIGGFFLREGRDGYRVLVLGRNGEPIAKLPVAISFTMMDITSTESVTLASNAEGEIELGSLPRVAAVAMTAQGVQPAVININRSKRQWPSVIHSTKGSSIELPLGEETIAVSDLSLMELRRGVPFRTLSKNIQVASGKLTISSLEAGNYELVDFQTGLRVRIAIVDTAIKSDVQDYFVGGTRSLENFERQPLSIGATSIGDKEIRVQLVGNDEHTRVHVLANAFHPTLDSAAQVRFGYPSIQEKARRRATSFYVDSLQLDEEYSYILQRQQATKYPGNLLAQPSLLVHPWEISLTANQTQEARQGDNIPTRGEAAGAAPAPMMADPQAKMQQQQTSLSYDFLAQGTLLAANLEVGDDGKLTIPLETLSGYSNITILAVHPTTSDSRSLALPVTPLVKRDLRLKESFKPESHLTEKQTVRVLKADEKVELGDARTSRVQLYTTLGDVYRVYGTLLKNPEWEKFRFVTIWPQLSDADKRSRYSEMSCHELDFFLYHKDRAFFDSVVAPLVSQKLDKQLVDQWLLDRSLVGYRSLWRMDRLNTLERVLLAQRLTDASSTTRRWLDEFLAAHPLEPEARSSRFETALRGTLLDSNSRMDLSAALLETKESEVALNFAMADQLSAMSDAAGESRGGKQKLEESLERANKKSVAPRSAGGREAFGARRLSLGKNATDRGRFFQTLDQTREWAETQYYKIRLQNQTPQLIAPSPFWQEYLKQSAGGQFLSQYLDLPVGSVNEALCAMAVLDLPWESPAPEMVVENQRLVVTAKKPAIAYVQSIEPAAPSEGNNSVLVGRDIYLAEPHTDEQSNRPVQSQALLIGIPYRSVIVVTNPSSSQKRVQVLSQLPAGAMALGGKITGATPITLDPYSTAQVQNLFYFPAAGQFDHYGGQVSSEGKHMVATTHESLRVLAEPESVDETTWSYIADWGSNDQVLAFLQKANLQKIDVSRIAFRLKDKSFYQQTMETLSRGGRFDATLWAYSIVHNDADNIAQLLHTRNDFTAQLGPAFDSRLLKLDPRVEMSYEHLDYKPLVVARIHQLGPKRQILNDRMFAQYSNLLALIAHQPQISDDQRMELCYYMLLQNRIEESLVWFGKVSVDNLATRLQYDYFDAYLDFFRGKYDRAAEIANRYAAYPVPRWRELFGLVSQQVQQRTALVSGQEITSVASLDSGLEREERIFSDRREAQQTRRAAESPSLDLTVADGVASIQFRNLDEVRINYYLMDIELLFSRNPFVSQSGDRLPAIRPNFTETLKLPGGAGAARKIDLPAEVRNRNLLVEVTGKGISRSSVLTANTLAVTVTEPYGRVQVRSQIDRAPVEAAYVKVYARHRDGSIRFFKDGYTDLRGQFDYATLSTGDLDTAERLAILVVDPKHGALVREATPPTR